MLVRPLLGEPTALDSDGKLGLRLGKDWSESASELSGTTTVGKPPMAVSFCTDRWWTVPCRARENCRRRPTEGCGEEKGGWQ